MAAGQRFNTRESVKCFTCPRERRGGESGWYFVELEGQARAGPARVFVCPRHYGCFAASERGRWTSLIDIEPVLIDLERIVQPA